MPRRKKTEEELEQEENATKKKTTKKKTSKKKTTKKKTSKKKTTKKKINKDKNPEIVEVKEFKEEPKEEKLISTPPDQYILIEECFFGLINENFRKGSVFDVDWAKRTFYCRETGATYDNIRDLEIGIRIGKLMPYDKEMDEEYLAVNAQRVLDNQKRSDNNAQRAKQRGKIVSSDEDIHNSIDISNTRIAKNKEESKQKTPPNSIIGIIKPRERKPMKIDYSDGTQESRIISRPEVINSDRIAEPTDFITTRNSFDTVKDSGRIREIIAKRISNFDIYIDPSGQQFIRGLPLVRNDSSAPDGYSLNTGQVTSFTREELARRTKEAIRISESYKEKAEQSRRIAGKEDNSDLMPREIKAGDSLDVEAAPRRIIRKGGIASKLLG